MIMSKKLVLAGLVWLLGTLSLTCAGADWFKDAVFYEVFVRSFADSNGDGIGDLKGLISKLDYLNDGNPATTTDLGITAIWLMPVFPSPSYHGYDITDYYGINKNYGTMEDFQKLIREAHKRGIRVILDLVLNHSSNQHPDFIAAASGASGPKRDRYVWEKQLPAGWSQPWTSGSTPESVWHRTASTGDFFYGIFWGGMPDLNYKNPDLQAEMIRVGKFWLTQGVDGFRLDAIRYLFEDGPGAGQQDTPSTHAYMARFYDAMSQVNKESVLVGEIWSDIDTIVPYLRTPRELDSAFNFDLASAIVGGVRDDNYNYINATAEVTLETYPKGAVDAIFLTNHDQNRIASELGPNPSKLKLAAAVLMTLSGTPFIYYGEEIGMPGVKPDENIRKPMLWDETENAGFSSVTPWNPKARVAAGLNVKAESSDAGSLLSHYRRLIAVRNQNAALRRGDYRVVRWPGKKIYAYLRSAPGQAVLVVHNFSRETVADLSIPVEFNLQVTRDLLAGTPCRVIPPLAAYETRLYEVAPVSK
jgi:alpha-amylase